jgi:hypothetical protein
METTKKINPDNGKRRGLGLSAIALAVMFNVPFSILAATFEYPDILRRPAGEALDKFAQGGAGLVLTWDAFALSSMALIPFAIAFALTPNRLSKTPALAIGAAIAGSLGGLAQAIGLFRWVFVVPGLAATHIDPASSAEAKLAAEHGFALLNQFAGVGIGEHMGQLLTALFVACMAGLQWGERARILSVMAYASAAAIVVGAQEGVMIAIGQSGEAFAMITIAGFLGLTLWLIGSGILMLVGKRERSVRAALAAA